MQLPSSASVLRKPAILKAIRARPRLGHYYHTARRKLPKRKAPLRKTFPTFEISDLLLDLDAEGVKGVRSFDDQFDGVPEHDSARIDREFDIVKQRVDDFEANYRHSASKFQTISTDPFNPMHINDVDILSIALGGFTSSTPNPRTQYTLTKVLDSNGAPVTMRLKLRATMEYMLNRQWQLRNLQPEGGDEAQLEEALNACASYIQLERVVTRTMRTQRGCQMLSRLGDKLTERFKTLYRSHNLGTALAFLNNLLINLDHHGLRTSSDLYEHGFTISIRCGFMSTAQQYLEKRLNNGDPLADDFIADALRMISGRTDHTVQFSLTLFSLLTGYVPGEKRKLASLRSLVDRENSLVFSLYIRCLLHLQAFRTMWHELHAADAIPWRKEPEDESSTDTQSGQLFLTNVAERIKNTKVSGNFDDDCQVDMVKLLNSLIYKTPRGMTRRVPIRKYIYLRRGWKTRFPLASERKKGTGEHKKKGTQERKKKGTQGRKKIGAQGRKRRGTQGRNKAYVLVRRTLGFLKHKIPATAALGRKKRGALVRRRRVRPRRLRRSIHTGSLYLQ